MAATFQIAASNQAPVGLYHVGSLTVLNRQVLCRNIFGSGSDGDTMIYHLASGLEMQITACFYGY